MAKKRVKRELTLSEKLREFAGYGCAAECQGRCEECPADLMRKAADELDALAAKVPVDTDRACCYYGELRGLRTDT